MSEGKHKKDRDRPAPPHEGSVSPTDPELATWLRTFWAREESPSRLELWQVFGRNGLDRGHQIFVEDFKNGRELDPEQVTKLANEVLAAAQHDTDCRQIASLYQIDVIDLHRSTKPIVRRLGPLHPQQTYLEKLGKPGAALSSQGGEEEDDDGLPLNGRGLSLRYIQELFAQIRFGQQLNYRVLGEMIQENRDDRTQVRSWLSEMMQLNIATHRQLQDAEDRKAEREIRLQMSKFKVDLMKEGMRTARNLLPGLFGPSAAPPGQSVELPGPQDGKPLSAAEEKRRLQRFSPEWVLLDNFFADVEEIPGLDVKLFGEWEIVEGRMRPVEGKAGIFTPEQCAVLFGVRMRALAPEALDVIVPRSGDPRQITEEQVIRAAPLMPESMGTAILELVALRERAKAAQKAPAAAPPAPADTQPSAPAGAADER